VAHEPASGPPPQRPAARSRAALDGSGVSSPVDRFGRTEPSVGSEGITTISQPPRSTTIEGVVTAFETLMQRLSGSHAPEFLEIDVTMPQAKVLYLLSVTGELRMSDLVAQLGVSLSTVSGLVDRIVDHGLAMRRPDSADRRHVVVSLTAAGREFVDRFRELNAAQVRALLALLTDEDLGQVASAMDALSDAAAELLTTTSPGGDPAVHPLATQSDIQPHPATERVP
jgi:DNA-binding MarR family transcriptional regulator